MITIVHNLNGVPLLAPPEINWPTYFTNDFDSYCGPGKGVGNYIVPDKFFGLKMSAACFVHDYMWRVSDSIWGDFHYSNSIFHHNMQTIIRLHGGWLYYPRLLQAGIYYMAVDIGPLAALFWTAKEVKKLKVKSLPV